MSLTARTLTKGFQHVASCRRAPLSTNYTKHGAHEALLHAQGDGNVKEHLRALLRNIAQPVAVVTSFMPPSTVGSICGDHETGTQTQKTNSGHDGQTSKFHGATLSSFTSIAMDPFPLIAFSLRIPSRMATTLSSLPASNPAHMVVNLLSAEQSGAAVIFSRPDLHPTPFESPEARHRLSKEGLPVLEGVVGAMSCRLVGKGIPLHDLHILNSRAEDACKEVRLGEGEVTSELFIAQVIRVEKITNGSLPLVYHHRSYTTCGPK